LHAKELAIGNYTIAEFAQTLANAISPDTNDFITVGYDPDAYVLQFTNNTGATAMGNKKLIIISK
jgi:hypothetical protein